MNDLIKKLNVLVKASLTDRLSGDEKPNRLSKNVEADVEALRGRINEAVQYEDEIKARIVKFEDEAARWDAAADDAVTRGDDAGARSAIEQMRRAQARARQAEDDLREHERTTQDLIQRVNVLDAVVSEARQAQSNQQEAPATSNAQVERGEAVSTGTQLPDLGGVLREAREKIAALADTAAAQREQQTPEAPNTNANTYASAGAGAPAAADNQQDANAVNDDIESRRQRLSKR